MATRVELFTVNVYFPLESKSVHLSRVECLSHIYKWQCEICRLNVSRSLPSSGRCRNGSWYRLLNACTLTEIKYGTMANKLNRQAKSHGSKNRWGQLRLENKLNVDIKKSLFFRFYSRWLHKSKLEDTPTGVFCHCSTAFECSMIDFKIMLMRPHFGKGNAGTKEIKSESFPRATSPIVTTHISCQIHRVQRNKQVNNWWSYAVIFVVTLNIKYSLGQLQWWQDMTTLYVNYLCRLVNITAPAR